MHFSKPFGVWSVLVLARNGIFNEPQHHVDLPGKRDAIGRMEPALLKLNNIRSKIGAQQNRIEYTIKNQLNVIDNTQASESLIRDADMADEIQKDLIKGTRSFRRNAITKVVNNTGGNVILASQLFGNSPDVALKHYFTKADEEQARKALEA